jgi:hypothetical protein
LINLGFEWVIQGDDNRNAQVDVSYRKQGDTQWKQGLPLLRLQGERIYQQGSWDVVSPNMFAGSILDLEPDTAYEARFVMSDPDGVAGQSAKTATKTVTVRTRPEPGHGSLSFLVIPAASLPAGRQMSNTATNATRQIASRTVLPSLSHPAAGAAVHQRPDM